MGANIYCTLVVLFGSLGDARKDLQALGRVSASRRALGDGGQPLRGRTVLFVVPLPSARVAVVDAPSLTLYDRNLCLRTAMRAAALADDAPSTNDPNYDRILPDCVRLGAPPCDRCRSTMTTTTMATLSVAAARDSNSSNEAIVELRWNECAPGHRSCNTPSTTRNFSTRSPLLSSTTVASTVRAVVLLRTSKQYVCAGILIITILVAAHSSSLKQTQDADTCWWRGRCFTCAALKAHASKACPNSFEVGLLSSEPPYKFGHVKKTKKKQNEIQYNRVTNKTKEHNTNTKKRLNTNLPVLR